MQNPMMQALSQSRLSGMMNKIQPIRNALNMVRNAQNPQAMMAQMLGNNPQMQQINQLISSAGGDPRKAFYALAEQNGIDPEQILNMLR